MRRQQVIQVLIKILMLRLWIWSSQARFISNPNYLKSWVRYCQLIQKLIMGIITNRHQNKMNRIIMVIIIIKQIIIKEITIRIRIIIIIIIEINTKATTIILNIKATITVINIKATTIIIKIKVITIVINVLKLRRIHMIYQMVLTLQLMIIL